MSTVFLMRNCSDIACGMKRQENVLLYVPLTERQKTIKRDIDELKKQNLLKHSDSRNNGYWIILSGAEK